MPSRRIGSPIGYSAAPAAVGIVELMLTAMSNAAERNRISVSFRTNYRDPEHRGRGRPGSCAGANSWTILRRICKITPRTGDRASLRRRNYRTASPWDARRSAGSSDEAPDDGRHGCGDAGTGHGLARLSAGGGSGAGGAARTG